MLETPPSHSFLERIFLFLTLLVLFSTWYTQRTVEFFRLDLPVPTNTPVPPTDTAVPPPVNSREIASVRLVSNQPGVLEVSWDAPSETPKDYRVSWARVGEIFLTWTDLSGNAFPTSASYTITGLDEGQRYKVKLRARYNGSSGDWTDKFEADVDADS